MRFTRTALIALLLPSMVPATVAAQHEARPLHRELAIEMAQVRSTLLPIAASDTAMAAATALTAHLRADPSLAASWTKSVPRWHLEVTLPLELFGVRGSRIRAGEATLDAARLRFSAVKRVVALNADTLYTRAVEARERATLSRSAAAAAAELLRIAILRRDAGDVADLDVALARINSGSAAATSAADSLNYLDRILSLQREIGADPDSVRWQPVDSISEPLHTLPTPSAGDTPDAIAAAAAIHAASLDVTRARHGRWAGFGLLAGIEYGDPSHGEPGILPVLGVTIPLPIFNRNRGAIAQATAARERTLAERNRLLSELGSTIARSRRGLEISMVQLGRDQELLAAALGIVKKTTEAYREGEVGLPAVIESQRSAREIEALHLTHLADAAVAGSVLRYMSVQSGGSR